MKYIKRTFAERFWKYVGEHDESRAECWEWKGPRMGDYGWMMYNRKAQGAHRWSYAFLVGPIPKGMLIDHKCSNPICVNPNHLRLANFADNARHRRTLGNTVSGVKGVSWNKEKKKWQAVIKVNSVTIRLGRFDDLQEAAKAYREAALIHHGEFASF